MRASAGLSLILLAVGSVVVAEERPAVRWLSDWEQGRKAARATGKPIFVVFRCEH